MLVPDDALPQYLANWLNFFPFEDARSDLADTTAPIHCIKFVSPEHHSRVLIKIDTDEMEP